jgi:hypothetical protein
MSGAQSGWQPAQLRDFRAQFQSDPALAGEAEKLGGDSGSNHALDLITRQGFPAFRGISHYPRGKLPALAV